MGRGRKCCKPASAASRSALSNRSAITLCSQASPTATTPASIPGTISTTWAGTGTNCGPITLHACNRPMRLGTPERGAMSDTHFGYETVAEEQKAKKVRGVFESVARKYDLMNDLMSLGVHR